MQDSGEKTASLPRPEDITGMKVIYSDAADFGEVKPIPEKDYFNISMDDLAEKDEPDQTVADQKEGAHSLP